MINAIRLTEELEKAGFTTEQAKKSVDTWMSLIDQNFATKSDLREFQLVTKADLKELQVEMKEMRNDLQTEIKAVRNDLEGQIKEFRNDLEGQIKDVKSEITQQSTKVVLQLGILMVTLFTIATSIISLVILK